MKEFYFYYNLPEVIPAENLDEALEKLQKFLDENETPIVFSITNAKNWIADYDLEEDK